jgi:hypothetical protein
MAFPTSPSDGEVYGNHRWSDAQGAWIKFPVASQAEAEAGTAGNVVMTPLRSEQNVSDHPEVDANTTHKGSAGTDHSDVGLNNTHRSSAGTDHSDVGLNNTHRGLGGRWSICNCSRERSCVCADGFARHGCYSTGSKWSSKRNPLRSVHSVGELNAQ